MRKKIVAGNWKMNTTVPEGVELAKAVLAKSAEVPAGVGLIVATPFTHLTEVAKVLAAKREQELEAKGELPATVDNVVDAPSTTCSQSHSETLRASKEPFLGLSVRRLPSHGETGGGLTVRPEVKDESKKKSGLLIPSHGETSHSETSVDNWAGETPPRCEAHYDWIRRHCRIMGMDATHTAKFLARHRQWGWNAMKPGVTVCDLIADYVTTWQEKFPNDYRETVDAVRNGSM